MKHKGNTFEFMRERNRDLLRVYKEQALAMTFIDADILMERIVKCPAKRFWVSEERARKVVARLMRGETMDGMKVTSKRMYAEIFRRTKSLMKEGMRMSEAITAVVYQPAPEFYLTPQSAAVILSHIRTKKYII